VPRLKRLDTVLLFLSAGILAAACNRQPSDADKGPPPAPPAAPAAPAAPRPEGPQLYVSDETGGKLIVVDPASGQAVEEIAVGKRPRGLHLSHDGAQVLVALSGSPIGGPGVDESKLPPPDRSADGIGVVDLATRKLLRTYKSGQDPESFDLSPDGRTVYVSNEDAAEMSIVDLASGEITHRVKVGEEPEGVTVRPDGRIVYVTCEEENEVVAVDTASAAVVGRIATGARPRSIAFTADSATAFVTNENDATVTVVDAQKHRVLSKITIPRTKGTPTPPRPMGSIMSPDGRSVYVSLGRARSVAVIDVAKRAFVRSIEDVGDRPWGIAVSADGRTLYTANGPSGDVSVIDIEGGRVEKKITTGGSPWGIVIGSAR
jgi:YVTN family beta-propeller protein